MQRYCSAFLFATVILIAACSGDDDPSNCRCTPPEGGLADSDGSGGASATDASVFDSGCGVNCTPSDSGTGGIGGTGGVANTDSGTGGEIADSGLDSAVADSGSGGSGGLDSGEEFDAGSNCPCDAGGGFFELPVDLGLAGDFAILAKAAISVVPISSITGDVGVSPAAATYITGFSLVADATNVFSTSPQVVGRAYAADYAPPTPANLTTAVSNMEAAFTDAAGRAADITELGAGDLSGFTLGSGVYKFGTGVLVSTDLTLNGSSTDVWIFQIAQDLTVANAAELHLTGGALAKNVFWQVSGFVEIGTTAQWAGVILCATQVALRTGSSVNGRLLAQTAVVLDSVTVVEPAP